MNNRAAIRMVVAGYLDECHPAMRDEFVVCFDDVCDSIEATEASSEEPAAGHIGFDGSLATGTVIAVAVWMTIKFFEAAFRDSIKRDLIPRLDQAEQRLIAAGADPQMVKRIRVRVEGILEEMADS